jgi:hypothetical protein
MKQKGRGKMEKELKDLFETAYTASYTQRNEAIREIQRRFSLLEQALEEVSVLVNSTLNTVK